MLSQSLGPDATLPELELLDSLAELTELTELALLSEDADEPDDAPSEAWAIDIVVKAGAA